MIKNTIIVPKGIRYISDWEKLENGYSLRNFRFPHILDKRITGCGFTEYCMRNNMNVVLCSPRRALLENKMDQHQTEQNVIYFKNDIELASYDRELFIKPNEETALTIEAENEKFQRLEQLKKDVENKMLNYLGIGCKILVTYDSFRHIKDILERNHVLGEFFVVIDEFQSIFVDSKFKSDAEIELLGHLNGIKNLCYVSATPMLDKYLEMLDEFKDLPYYELDWVTEDPGRIISPEVSLKQCKSVIYEINSVIKTYQAGNFEGVVVRDKTGNLKEIESKEAVIYVNSVKNICDIIRKNNLTPDNTNVLCADTKENQKKIKRAFKASCGVTNGTIGTIPKKGELHKMFTLCTRTVYLGADFYSTNARSFIVSDANIDTLTVDIALDLPQILGRQRLADNPWKNRIEIYFKPLKKGKELTKEDFDKILDRKYKDSIDLLEAYNKTENRNLQHLVARKYESAAKIENYRNDFVAVNHHAGSDLLPVLNKLVMVAEMRTYEIQQVDYRDRASTFSSIEDSGLTIIKDNIDHKVDEFSSLQTFVDKMKYVCCTGFNEFEQKYFLNQIPIQFGEFYNILGPERCRSLKYRHDLLRNEITALLNKGKNELKEDVYEAFPVGAKISRSIIKQELGVIYKRHNINKTPKATDIQDYFELKDCKISNPNDPKKRDEGFEILKIKEL